MDGGDRGFGDDGGKDTGFISHHEEEWQLVGDRMGVVIMHEFCKGNMLCPGGQVRATEDPKVGFDFLVNSFSFSISPWVVCSGESEFVAKKISEFFSECRSKLECLVRDDFIIEAKSLEYF